LAAWLDVLLHLYANRILAFDLSAARIAGALSDLARSQGTDPGFGDIAVAATARRHGLTILTRNTRHFAPLGVPAINPYSGLPP
jgi:toxin FitB